jgi:hypothetical protein
MPMSPDELKATLQAEKADALAAQSASKLSSEREAAMDYYLGDMSRDLPTIEGRSSAVSMDVADTIEGLMPSLMEVFCGGDEVVRFEPVGPEDEEAAEQETDYVNHVFMQQNPGFLVLYSFIKDALLSKVGVAKVYWDEEESEERETYLDQGEDVFALISADPEVEIVEHSERQEAAGAPDGGESVPVTYHDITVATRKTYSCAKVEPVPPEEFGIARRAKSIKDADYCFHEVVRSESDLIEAGFDAGQVRTLETYGETAKTSEESSRDTVDESGGAATAKRALRQIRVTEHYIRMDYEGNDKARLYRVTTGGEQGSILRRDGKEDVVEEDFIPFAAMTPVIVTHRFFGRSIADLVMDIQKIKTALLRAQLDNAYLANNPRIEVPEPACSDVTLDDLLVSRPGGIVRTKQPGMLQVIQHPDIGANVFPLMEYLDTTRETRTGVTRTGQGIDADALQNQTATASNNLFNAAQARMRLIARIFAETGVKDLFSLLHAVIRKNGKQAQTVRLQNKWVQVDPRNWKTRNDMTINVGIGTGGKTERLGQLTVLGNWQKELVLGGKSNLVRDENLFNTAKEITKVLELKNVEMFFTDPNSPEGQQAAANAPPDPEMMKLQAESQMKTQEMQQNAQLKTLEMQQKAEIEKLQAEADIATQREKIGAELQMMREKHQLEMVKLQAEIERDREKHTMAMEQNAVKVQVAREGHAQKSEFAAQSHEQSMAERKEAAKEGAE